MSATDPLRGEATLKLNDVDHILVFDWDAVARITDKFGTNANLFHPKTLAGVLEIGLQKHHKGVTAAQILKASPPVVDAIAAFNKAMQRAYFGDKEPPADAAENPLMAGIPTSTPST
jgi:hypothetical protein